MDPRKMIIKLVGAIVFICGIVIYGTANIDGSWLSKLPPFVDVFLALFVCSLGVAIWKASNAIKEEGEKNLKRDDSSGVTKGQVNNGEKKQSKTEPDTVEKEDKKVNTEQKDEDKRSVGCESPAQVTNSKQYYYSKGREKKGPFTEDELIKLKLRPDTLIWTVGLEKWQSLSEFDGLIKTPPPLPNEVQPYRANPRKRIAVSLVLLVLLLGGSFISTYFIMENRRDNYMRLINAEIDQIFDGRTTLCEGKEYSTSGELRPVCKPIKSPDKSEYTYNLELEAYKEDIQTGAIERFHSEGISFKYHKLVRRNSGFRIERLWSADMVYFYEATVRYGSNPPRRLVTPEEAYNSSFRGILDDNSECLIEGFNDILGYLKDLSNRYFQISLRESDQLSGGARGTDYYRVYYERSYSDYYIEDRFSIRQDFIKFLSMFGGISILLAILLYILNPFKW